MLISRVNLVAPLALAAALWTVTGSEAAEGLFIGDLNTRDDQETTFDDQHDVRDMPTSRVQEVRIYHKGDDNDEVIYGIQMIHDQRALELHGYNEKEARREKVPLSVFELKKGEYITAISGTFDDSYINSLYIHYAQDNKPGGRSDRFGAIDNEHEDYFLQCPLSNYEVVGFKGRDVSYIDAIGIICRPR